MNHTFNLRNAPGYGVDMDGEIIQKGVQADGEHSDAKTKTIT